MNVRTIDRMKRTKACEWVIAEYNKYTDWYGSKNSQVWKLIDRTCSSNRALHKLRFDQVQLLSGQCVRAYQLVCAYFTEIKLPAQINQSCIYRQRWRYRQRARWFGDL